MPVKDKGDDSFNLASSMKSTYNIIRDSEGLASEIKLILRHLILGEWESDNHNIARPAPEDTLISIALCQEDKVKTLFHDLNDVYALIHKHLTPNTPTNGPEN